MSWVAPSLRLFFENIWEKMSSFSLEKIDQGPETHRPFSHIKKWKSHEKLIKHDLRQNSLPEYQLLRVSKVRENVQVRWPQG